MKKEYIFIFERLMTKDMLRAKKGFLTNVVHVGRCSTSVEVEGQRYEYYVATHVTVL
jgi:hypothetical protein